MGKTINLGIFASENIQSATLGLLSDLGIDMEVRSQQQIPIPAVVAASLGQTPKAIQDICDKISESYLAGIISDKTFTGEYDATSFEEACENAGRYEQMMVFAVDFKKSDKITRTEMATLTRGLNRASKACPVVLVCRYADGEGTRFALSLCERTAYKQAGHTGEKAGKVNILRGINPENPHTGHVRILEDMRLEKKDNTFEAVYNKWFGVFDNDVLTNQFYKELQDWFFWAVKHVQFPNDIEDDKDDKKYNPQNVIRLITRLIFVWFLRQKGLVPKELFNREDLNHLVKDFEPDNFESSTYYRVILQNLFFATLNKKIDERAFISDSFIENRNLGKHKIKTFMRHARDLAVSKEKFIELLRPVPFMNNSLFECLDNKEQNGRTYNWDGFSDSNKPQRQAFVPNYLFFAKEEYVDLSEEYDRASASSTKVFGLLNILKRYNFTVEENTPLDQDVALDPELLGKVFENLLAAYNPETEQTVRKSTGSYYTPRPIVQYMVDESLVAYLKKAVPDVEEETLRSLLSYSNDDQASTLNEQQTHNIVEAILNCKVLDPACGSGAFPMGMLQQMSHLLSRVDASNKYWEEVVINRALNDEAFVEKTNDEEKETLKNEIEEVFKLSVNYPDYARKLYLIENCIYGVDLQSIAVQISRLRFFISLLCEQQPSDDASKNYNIKPLPNLEMKFVSANSLVKLEHIDEARELFANKDILDLIAQLKGVRHELFVVTDHHVKEKLLCRDETLRSKIMLSTGECYVKSIEDKIREYEETLVRLEKELAVAERQPDEFVQQPVQYDLFGEKTEIITVNRKETKIKDITGRIRHFKHECKRLNETLTSGRDKAMRLAKQLTDWNPYDQNVSSPFFDPEWMFGISDGFDVVIGNPPYVQIKKLSLKDTYRKVGYDSYDSTGDIYCLFYEFATKVMKEQGYGIYITSNKWLKSNYGASLRNYLLNFSNPQLIIDLGPGVFDTAAVDTNIMLWQNCKYELKTRVSTVCDSLSSLSFSTIELKKDSIWSLDNSDYLSIRDKVELIPTKLSNIGVELDYGILTGANKTFILSEQTAQELISLDKHNRDIIKPILRGQDLGRYCATFNGIYLLCSHNGVKKENIPPIDIEKDYPTLIPYFESFDEKFRNRGEQGDSYYNLRNCAYILKYENPKIIYADIVQDQGKFYYDEEKFYTNDTAFIITGEHLIYLTGLLNSKAFTFLYRQFYCGGSLGKKGLRFKRDYLLRVPIPMGDAIIRSKIESFVSEICVIRKNNHDGFIEHLEKQIDHLVYHLYNLTYDEVLIIDPDTKITRDEYDNL